MNSKTNTSQRTRLALWNQWNAHNVSDVLLEKIFLPSETIILFQAFTLFIKLLRYHVKRYVRPQLPSEAATKGVLKNFTKFTGKHLYQVSFLIKLQTSGLQKRLWHRRFPVIFVKFLGTPFLQNTSGRLLLLL